jgi:hypothetical protein
MRERAALKQVEVIYLRARAATSEKTESQRDARLATVQAVRKVESFLQAVAPLKGLPNMYPKLRAIRVRAASWARLDRLKPGEEAFCLDAFGKFLMLSQTEIGIRHRELRDDEIIAEDLNVVLLLAEELLQRHALLCEASSKEYVKATRIAQEIAAIRE